MDLSNLRFNRIAVHYIPNKSASEDADPEYGDDLIELGSNAQDILTQRVTEVLGDPSFSVEISIIEDEEDSTFQKSAPLIRASTEEFLDGSRHIADNLNDAQQRSNIPASVLLVATGKSGIAQNNIVALVKAETQDGFSFSTSEGDIRVDFIRDLFLTPDQKLYKVGLFAEMSRSSDDKKLREKEDFEALVYDSNLRQRSEAAKYFYRTFLGCDYASSGKQMTKEFFEAHQEYFDSIDISSEERKDLKTHLYSYLKSKQNLIGVAGFADNYIGDSDRASYLQFMDEREIADHAFEKDISLVQSKLKNRRIRFTNGVTVRAKAEKFNEKVKVIKEETDTTTIRVLSKIENQT